MQLCRILLILAVLLAVGAAILAACQIPFVWLALAALLIALAYRKGHQSVAHGSSRWATTRELAHMFEGPGLGVGEHTGTVSLSEGVGALFNSRLDNRASCQKFLQALQKDPKFLVRLTRAVHVACFAPTGAGKGVSLIVPFLLSSRESCVVLDYKGENAFLTRAARARMRHHVVLLDPFRVVTETPDCLNVLDFIDRDAPTALDHIRSLAEAIVVRSGHEKEPHWLDSAETWITAITAVVIACAADADRNLQSVRSILTNPAKIQLAIRVGCASDAWGGMLSRLCFQLTQFQGEELASVLTTTNRVMRYLDTLATAESSTRSTFDPAWLLDRKMSVYLIVPPEHQRTQVPLLRLWLTTLMKAVVRGGLQQTTKVNFVLDEAASLGRMTVVDDALDKFRGYGIRLQLYYQSLGQLRSCYSDGGDMTLLSNTSKIFFGVNDWATAELVSNLLGDETIVTASGGTGSGSSHQTSPQGGTYGSSTSANDNWSYLGRRLLTPSEVLNLPERVAIVLAPGLRPFWTWLIPHYLGSPARAPGLTKSLVHAVLLFLLAAALAVASTAAWFGFQFGR
ncbi:conjugal transfer coupling protein : Type IV secretory pathway, VirD4 component OS=Singulisphaera acidiphila (strain ATCC BAA-1392 / DSM 18658 / VKM B-2454 / MOB10) GN=Sinac_7665 PE=4 SV=1: T4SS-DNA_transf [Gemmata massiliana]|uniref:Uncharacterized protein n=1 Tax=Gemmata massiliana TaxID=1210884 RepID=A0A6P2CWX1_9BACT|nr:type IV secretory system conjugative DNA transfer family protein [Gemmata massiliana]VTR92886.1 conjugal transfer coupling protein : Type IV secretory pathway, VirD4 component OS=Singulisphaera acidiphila (strain ATCC BAA-1392 / DSM 18658 / VKM B-2454 / MOB10) GN=Sinac_7665 PE=4 SV=1: T4SS-DNA_transf [Gemmata massiliana]